MKKNSIITFFSLLAIMAFCTAVSALTLFSQSIRLDESQSLWDATKPLAALLKFTAQDVQAPLYLVILHFWTQFLGTDIIYSRLISLIFFLLSLPVLYLVAKESSDRKIAIVTVLFFALSPFVIWYSNEARTYTLFTLVTSLNHLFFLRMMRSKAMHGKIGYFFSSVAGFYTHYFFVFLVFTQAVYVLFDVCVKMYREQHTFSLRALMTKYRQPTWDYIGLTFAAFCCFLPWVIYFIRLGAGASTAPLIAPPTSYNIFQTFVNFLFGFQSQGTQSLIVSLWPLLVVTFFFIFTQRNRIKAHNIAYFVLVTFLPIMLVYIGSYVKPIFLSRYLIFVTPTLFFIVAWFLMSYSKKVSAFLIGGFMIVMIVLLIYQNVSTSTPVKEDYAGVDHYLSTHAQPSDIIAVSAPFTIYPIEYGYTGHSSIATIPEWDRYTQGIPPFTLTKLQQQMKKYQTEYEHIYVVLSYDQGYQKYIQQYMDTHYAREQLTKFSPGLEVREYKLRYD